MSASESDLYIGQIDALFFFYTPYLPINEDNEKLSIFELGSGHVHKNLFLDLIFAVPSQDTETRTETK